MPEHVFGLYNVHARRWGLPTRRLQLQLAKLAQLVDLHMGKHEAGERLYLRDYLMDPDDDEGDDEMTPEEQLAAAREYFGVPPPEPQGG